MYVMPYTGHVFMFCGNYGEIVNPMTGGRLMMVPSFSSFSRFLNTQYPYTGTSVMLPLLPSNNYQPSIMYFGGQFR